MNSTSQEAQIPQQQLSLSETLVQLRQFLGESSQLFFFLNYHFEYNSVKISEYSEIGTFTEEESIKLHIILDPFDEQSAKHHVKQTNEVLNNPGLLKVLLQGDQNYQSANQKFKFFPKQGTNNQNQNIEQEQQEKKQQNEAESEEGQFQEEPFEEMFTLDEAIKPILDNKFFNHKLQTNQKTQLLSKFVNTLAYSGYNPPPNYCRIKGDFFYLYLKTLENSVYHITASARGFYLNQSNLTEFSRESLTNYPIFASLLDLIQTVSPLFRQPWLSLGPTQNEEISHSWNMNRTQEYLVNLFGCDLSVIRDWNEELNLCQDLPQTDMIQRLNRDKAMIKVYSDFISAAVEGAKAVVEKNILPLNPMDPQTQHVYVYNHIFFSLALETPNSFQQDIGPQASPTVSTTNCDLRNIKLLHQMNIPGLHLLNTALIDYKGNRIIAQSIIPGILSSDHLNCCQYGSLDEGKTINCSPQFEPIMKLVTENFWLDDSITYVDEANQEVDLAGSLEVQGIRGSDQRMYILDLMRLSPRDLNYPDMNKHLCCVLRHELINNYIATKNLELASENLQQEELKEKSTATTTNNTSNSQNSDNSTPQSSQTTTSPPQPPQQNDVFTKIIQIQEFLSKQENLFKLKINPSIGTNCSMKESQKTKEQRKQLEDLSKYLLEKSIPNLIGELINSNENSALTDSKSIEVVFHSHGVNMRYLGRVIGLVDKKEHPHVYLCLQRVILVKSLKHIFREAMRDTEEVYIATQLAHLLNCVFSPVQVLNKLNNAQIIPDYLSEVDLLDDQQEEEKKSEKNKKQNKKNQKESTAASSSSATSGKITDDIEFKQSIQIDTPNLNSITPNQVWEQLRSIAKDRYNHTFPQQIEELKEMQYSFNKIALLRDLCLNIGLSIQLQNYELIDVNTEVHHGNSKNSGKAINDKKQSVADGPSSSQIPSSSQNGSSEQRSTLPFSPSNIIEIYPIIKHIQIKSEDFKSNFDLGNKLSLDNKYKEALDMINTAAQIILNLYGPYHYELALCYNQIAQIYCQLDDFEHAIIYQQNSIDILEKIFGVDDFHTGYAYSNLGYFYFALKLYQQGYEYILRGLYIFSIVGGESNPDSLYAFINLSLMYQDSNQDQIAIKCLFEALDRNIFTYGKEHIKVANCYQAIAFAHFQIQDMKKAIEFQTKSIDILKLLLSPEDITLQNAQSYLATFQQNLNDKQQVQTEGNSNNSKYSYLANNLLKIILNNLKHISERINALKNPQMLKMTRKIKPRVNLLKKTRLINTIM